MKKNLWNHLIVAIMLCFACLAVIEQPVSAASKNVCLDLNIVDGIGWKYRVKCGDYYIWKDKSKVSNYDVYDVMVGKTKKDSKRLSSYSDMFFDGEQFYYKQQDYNYKDKHGVTTLYCLDRKGKSKKIKKFNELIDIKGIYGNKIYFSSFGKGVFCYNTKSRKTKKILSYKVGYFMEQGVNYVCDGSSIILLCSNEMSTNDKIYKIDMKTGNVKSMKHSFHDRCSISIEGKYIFSIPYYDKEIYSYKLQKTIKNPDYDGTIHIYRAEFGKKPKLYKKIKKKSGMAYCHLGPHKTLHIHYMNKKNPTVISFK